MIFRRRILLPEVIQTSAIDCGPACLSALLEGFKLHASFGRLREACQTGIDGTSIDVLEQLANQAGLSAEQVVIPADHFALAPSRTVPCITVVQRPGGMTHFVVVWRRLGSRLQIMDPAVGRRWTRASRFQDELYRHEMIASAAAWREFAESPEFRAALQCRLRALGLRPSQTARRIEEALQEPDWLPIAVLDAAARMTQPMVAARAFSSARTISGFLQDTIRAAIDSSEPLQIIPAQYWSARPIGQEGQVAVRGVVLIRANGRAAAATDCAALPREVAAAMSEPSPRPFAELWRLLRRDGVLRPTMIAGALAASSIGIAIQALIFRVMIEGGRGLTGRGQRLGAIAAIFTLMLILLCVDIPAVAALVKMGRRLEARMRTALFEKLPRIADQYFHSRPASDMAARSHNLYTIRALPALAGQFVHSFFDLVVTTAAVICLDPPLWPIAAGSAATALALPLLMQPVLGERELRARTHAGALSRFYLDALLGLTPVRAHAADCVLRSEQRSLLGKWADASMSTQRISIRAHWQLCWRSCMSPGIRNRPPYCF